MDIKCKNCKKDFELFTSDFCCDECAEEYFVHPKWGIMEQMCMHCGKIFEGSKEKFCSEGCKYSHVAVIKKRIREAIDSDPNHTSRLSRD